MKKWVFLMGMLLTFFAEAAVLAAYGRDSGTVRQDAAAVNAVVKSLEADWNRLGTHQNETELDYVVLDQEGTVLFKTREQLSENMHDAVVHGDLMLDITQNGETAGRVIIRSISDPAYAGQKRNVCRVIFGILCIQLFLFFGYSAYLDHSIIKPFRKLKRFAERVAGGNLDVPLEMDRENLFGAFTESFDMMRSQLLKAQQAAALAEAAKKELTAELSHDIKTPAASIKAAAELGVILSESERMRDNYTQIIRKADQINTLVTNLFTASLEELQQLSVEPADLESRELETMLENSDYLHHASIPKMPDCLLCADRLRLQQVLDNIFSNSYKYADTQITVSAQRRGSCFVLIIEDCGGGVAAEELPLLKEKFWRGNNAKGSEGAGLGLFISDYFMKGMGGELTVENGTDGLKTSVVIRVPVHS